ncbi:CinA family protein, partial [Campylobacter jejuni]|nr:CinA family protein [Campylobacter jejuni]
MAIIIRKKGKFMKHLLYLIGDELTINEKFKNYIYRTYEE